MNNSYRTPPGSPNRRMTNRPATPPSIPNAPMKRKPNNANNRNVRYTLTNANIGPNGIVRNILKNIKYQHNNIKIINLPRNAYNIRTGARLARIKTVVRNQLNNALGNSSMKVNLSLVIPKNEPKPRARKKYNSNSPMQTLLKQLKMI